jgi:predicted phage tail protein
LSLIGILIIEIGCGGMLGFSIIISGVAGLIEPQADSASVKRQIRKREISPVS